MTSARVSLPASMFTDRRVKPNHIRVFAVLAMHRGKSPLSKTDIARESGIDRSDVYRALKDLEAFGFYNQSLGKVSYPDDVGKFPIGENPHSGENPHTPAPLDVPPSLPPGPPELFPPFIPPSSPHVPLEGDPTPRKVAERFVDVWRQELGDVLAVPTKLSDDRIRAANLRFRVEFSSDIERWRAHLQGIRGSPFCLGEGGGWRADFDWALKPKSIIRVHEGKYRGTPAEHHANGHQRKLTPTESLYAGAALALAQREADRGENHDPPQPLLDRRGRA